MVAAPMCLFAEVKIGTVDTQEVFTLMPELKTAQASLEEVNKKYQTEYKALQEEFNKKLQEYQALAKDTPETIKQRREQELNELGQKIQTFEQVANQDIQSSRRNSWLLSMRKSTLPSKPLATRTDTHTSSRTLRWSTKTRLPTMWLLWLRRNSTSRTLRQLRLQLQQQLLPRNKQGYYCITAVTIRSWRLFFLHTSDTAPSWANDRGSGHVFS